jgi:hypothetical protein
MRLHLDYTPKKPGFTIGHDDQIFLLGSCFSTHIGSLLVENRFPVLSNPAGIQFNPQSVLLGLESILGKGPEPEKFMLQRGDQFYSYLCHSSVHAFSQQALLKEINKRNSEALEFLKNADYLFITFGTAFFYRHLALGAIVANCHKQPGTLFKKELLSVEQITDPYEKLINDLKALNKKLRIIFTVSPVKHLKDGVVENNLSKSTLLLAVHKLVAEGPGCFYFPAYELINDDLRDYRFYKEDLAHPNQQAIEYVWNKFSSWCFDSKTLEINKELRKLHLALHHRQIIDSEDHDLAAFIKNQKQLVNTLKPGLVE